MIVKDAFGGGGLRLWWKLVIASSFHVHIRRLGQDRVLASAFIRATLTLSLFRQLSFIHGHHPNNLRPIICFIFYIKSCLIILKSGFIGCTKPCRERYQSTQNLRKNTICHIMRASCSIIVERNLPLHMSIHRNTFRTLHKTFAMPIPCSLCMNETPLTPNRIKTNKTAITF